MSLDFSQMKPRFDAKMIALGLIALVCLGGVALWAWKGDVLGKLRAADLRIAALGLIPGMIHYALKSWRYLVVIGGRAHWRRLMGITLVQNILGMVAPLRLGDIAYIVMLKSNGIAAPGMALASLALVYLIDVLVLWGLYLYGWVAASIEGAEFQYISWGVGVALTLCVALLVGALAAANWVRPRVEGFWRWSRLERLFEIEKLWAVLDDGARAFVQSLRPGKLFYLLALSAALWACSTAWTWLTFAAFGVRMTPPQAAFLTSLMNLIAPLPIFVLGGVGLGDAITLGVLVSFGYARDAAAAFSLCARVLFSAHTGVYALALPFLLGRRKKERPRAETG